MKMRISSSLCLGLLFFAVPLYSDADVRTRYGAVIKSDVSIEGGLTSTYQISNDNRLHDEALFSLDLLAHRNLGEGQITLYAEAVSTPQANGIAASIIEANGDAGTALDGEGRGRFQVSEFHYTCVQRQNCFTLGLLDPSAFADLSAVANNEASQFLNQNFINNPTIAFPDYTLGLVWHRDYRPGQPGYTLLLSSSHGLADNPDRSYSELLDVSAPGKGVFSLLETYMMFSTRQFRVGAWYSSADHPRLDSGVTDVHDYGIYSTFDIENGDTQWNLRLGAANPAVSETAYTLSIAMERPLSGTPVGIALGHNWLSSRITDPAQADESTLEIYAYFKMAKRLNLSPSLQLIRNPRFDRSENRFETPLAVYSLRLGYQF